MLVAFSFKLLTPSGAQETAVQVVNPFGDEIAAGIRSKHGVWEWPIRASFNKEQMDGIIIPLAEQFIQVNRASRSLVGISFSMEV